MSKTHQRHLIVSCWRNVCDLRVLRIPPGDADFLCPLRLAKCSHMIDILHVERNKVGVSSHVKSSLYLFHVAFHLSCLNSL